MQAVVSVSSSASRTSSFYLPLVIGILFSALKSSAASGDAFDVIKFPKDFCFLSPFISHEMQQQQEKAQTQKPNTLVM